MSVDFWSLLADLVLVVHALFVGFVVMGQGLILVGVWRGWLWVRNRILRLLHLLAIGMVVLQAWIGVLCPLTVIENALRVRAGESPYAGAYIRYWLHRLIFYDAEPWVFTMLYTVFGAVVVLTWYLAGPGERQR